MKRPNAISFQEYFLLDINAVIRTLIVSDIVLTGSAGLLGPIFALYIEGYISAPEPLAVAGVAAAIYFVTRSILQIPVAEMIDRIPGERDDFFVLFLASLVMGIVPLGYLWVHTPLGLYVIQAILGIATAFSYPSYMAIFTRHIDAKKEGTEWGVYFTLTDLCAAATAAIGGVLAATAGFRSLIIGIVFLNVLGALLLLPIRRHLRMPKSRS